MTNEPKKKTLAKEARPFVRAMLKLDAAFCMAFLISVFAFTALLNTPASAQDMPPLAADIDPPQTPGSGGMDDANADSKDQDDLSDDVALQPIATFSKSRSGKRRRGIFTAVIENDLFYDQDRNYTNGIRLEYSAVPDAMPELLQKAADFSGLFPKNATYLATYALGQNMYTPRDITAFPAPADQRPYAGWLYGEVGLAGENGDSLYALKISLGVVGPWARAKEAQRLVHAFIDSPNPLGWGSQLRNEPAVQIAYQRSWRSIKTTRGDFGFEVMPHVGVNVGNVFTNLQAGGTVRLGWRLPRDYGVPRIQPSVPGSAYYETDKLGIYFFAGAEGRAIARNIFLDGNSFRDGPSVEKKNFVADVQVGAAAVWRWARVAYTRVFRTREFEGQIAEDNFGALSFSIAF